MPRAKKEKRVISNIVMEGARIIFRNFGGKGSDYNREGDRNFCVVLDPELANKLEADGWNVKRRQPKDPDDDVLLYLKVNVRFNNYPPRITLIKERGGQPVEEEDVHVLDFVETEYVDLIIRPYEWEVGSKSGIAAYLKTMYVKVKEDALTRKYQNVPVYDPSQEDGPPPWED